MHNRALCTNAIDELMRLLSIAHNGRPRVALEDVGLGGDSIRAGLACSSPTMPRNCDRSVFPLPATLDIHRAEARHQLGPGFGTHRFHGELLAEAGAGGWLHRNPAPDPEPEARRRPGRDSIQVRIDDGGCRLTAGDVVSAPTAAPDARQLLPPRFTATCVTVSIIQVGGKLWL